MLLWLLKFSLSRIGIIGFGNGFFKPNMTSIVSEMYKDRPEKKDGAYTLFYMGVNAGAFFGILLCGYLGEKVGWTWVWFSRNLYVLECYSFGCLKTSLVILV
jgi:dipeptide/tripeptide permease